MSACVCATLATAAVSVISNCSHSPGTPPPPTRVPSHSMKSGSPIDGPTEFTENRRFFFGQRLAIFVQLAEDVLEHGAIQLRQHAIARGRRHEPRRVTDACRHRRSGASTIRNARWVRARSAARSAARTRRRDPRRARAAGDRRPARRRCDERCSDPRPDTPRRVRGRDPWRFCRRLRPRRARDPGRLRSTGSPPRQAKSKAAWAP